jgi:hypothetical protein
MQRLYFRRPYHIIPPNASQTQHPFQIALNFEKSPESCHSVSTYPPFDLPYRVNCHLEPLKHDLEVIHNQLDAAENILGVIHNHWDAAGNDLGAVHNHLVAVRRNPGAAHNHLDAAECDTGGVHNHLDAAN